MNVGKSYRIAALILLCVSTHLASADPVSPVSAKVAVLNEVAQALGSKRLILTFRNAIKELNNYLKHDFA
jgi:hypothetical protein